jgi:hypothetical protein
VSGGYLFGNALDNSLGDILVDKVGLDVTVLPNRPCRVTAGAKPEASSCMSAG